MTYIDPPKSSSLSGKPGALLTFAEVEEQLIEAFRLWLRSPGGGKWPFAGDGPWHLVRDDGSAQAAWDERVNEHKMGAERPRPLPLSRDEVGRRDRVSEWIRFAPERDRKLVSLVVEWKARTGKDPKWARIRLQLIKAGEPAISARGIGMRYSRAITAIARALDGR